MFCKAAWVLRRIQAQNGQHPDCTDTLLHSSGSGHRLLSIGVGEELVWRTDIDAGIDVITGKDHSQLVASFRMSISSFDRDKPTAPMLSASWFKVRGPIIAEEIWLLASNQASEI